MATSAMTTAVEKQPQSSVLSMLSSGNCARCSESQ